MLDHSTYEGDMGVSKSSMTEIHQLIVDADMEFKNIGHKSKKWTITGSKPSEIVSEDRCRVLVGGLRVVSRIGFCSY